MNKSLSLFGFFLL